MKGLSLDGARPLPLQWEEKINVSKLIDRVVGSLVSLTYSYFKIIPLLKLLSREDILSLSLL